MRSLGAADKDVVLTAILISDFWIGLASLLAPVSIPDNSAGPLEKRFDAETASGCSRVGLRMPRMKAFSDPAMQSSSVLSAGNAET